MRQYVQIIAQNLLKIELKSAEWRNFSAKRNERHNCDMKWLKVRWSQARVTWMNHPGWVAAVSALLVGLLLSIPAVSLRSSLVEFSSGRIGDQVGSYQVLYVANLLAELRADLARCMTGEPEGKDRAGMHAKLLEEQLRVVVPPYSVGVDALREQVSLAIGPLSEAWGPESGEQCHKVQDGLFDPGRLFMNQLIGSASAQDLRLRLDAGRIEAAGGMALGWLFFVVGLFASAVYSAGWALRARQEQVIARQQAEASERAKNEFIGMATHEVLSPIHVLLASLDTVRARGGISTEDPVFMRLDTAAKQVADQVGDMIDFAELTSGRMRIRHKRFVMEPLVDAVLEQFEGELIEKDLHVEWVVHPSLSDAIWSDPQRIRQILTNLYSNAIKYTERGTITLVIEVLQEPSELYIEVSDTGVGIQAEDMEAIFEPFSRLPSAPDAKGHGLGLSVVRHLVTAMQGRASVKSEPGVGSTFIVELPVGDNSASAEIGNLAPRRILVVEDNELVRGPTLDALRALGWTVHAAASFGQARSEIADNLFDAALVDYDLPDGSGEDVARLLRLHSPAARIVLLSGNTTVGAKLDSTCFDIHLTKPADMDEVLAALA